MEWNETINASYTSKGSDYTLVNIAASNKNGSMNMETATVIPGRPISCARLTDKNGENIVRPVPVRIIDSLMREYPLPAPYLQKIDVHGVELLTMEGAKETFASTNVVVVEKNIKNFIERGTFLLQNGFKLFDIIDNC